MAKKLKWREVEAALAVGVARVQPMFSVRTIIALDLHLRDGRRLLVAPKGGGLRFRWGIWEQVAEKQ
jgi:hypothetical protein